MGGVPYLNEYLKKKKALKKHQPVVQEELVA
jgi:hypothetical protein